MDKLLFDQLPYLLLRMLLLRIESYNAQIFTNADFVPTEATDTDLVVRNKIFFNYHYLRGKVC